MPADARSRPRHARRRGRLRPRPRPRHANDGLCPSGLHEACHEPPYRPGAGGFGEWPATKWPWGFELARRGDVVAAKIHRGKTLFLSAQAAALADPICRAEIERMEAADEGWAVLLRHLGNMGPSLAEDVQRELDLKPKELKALRSPLERCGAVVARFFQVDDDWVTELVRWDQLAPSPRRTAGSRSWSSRASALPSSVPTWSRSAGFRGRRAGRGPRRPARRRGQARPPGGRLAGGSVGSGARRDP